MYPNLKAELQGQVVQSLIKLFHNKQEFGLSFFNFALGFSVYMNWPYVLILNNVGLHQESMTQKK